MGVVDVIARPYRITQPCCRTPEQAHQLDGEVRFTHARAHVGRRVVTATPAARSCRWSSICSPPWCTSTFTLVAAGRPSSSRADAAAAGASGVVRGLRLRIPRRHVCVCVGAGARRLSRRLILFLHSHVASSAAASEAAVSTPVSTRSSPTLIASEHPKIPRMTRASRSPSRRRSARRAAAAAARSSLSPASYDFISPRPPAHASLPSRKSGSASAFSSSSSWPTVRSNQQQTR